MGNELFQKVVRESGLAPQVAVATLRRALASLGLEPDELTPADLRRALPAIERALRVFLPLERTRESMAKIGQLGG